VCHQLTIGNQIFKVFSVPADSTGLPTLNEAEISVRLRFMGSYRGKHFIQLAHAYQYGAPHPQAQWRIVPESK
jgi:hypothetical protein